MTIQRKSQRFKRAQDTILKKVEISSPKNFRMCWKYRAILLGNAEPLTMLEDNITLI